MDDAQIDRPREVLLVAAKKDHVKLRTQPLLDAGIPLRYLQSDCVALANLLLLAWQSRIESLGPRHAIALVNLGAAATNLVVVSRQSIWFRSTHHGISKLNKRLISTWDLTHKQATDLRHRPEQAKLMYRLDELLCEGFAELADNVQRSLQTYERTTQRNVVGIALAGGGASQFGLFRFLQQGETSLPE